MNGQAGETGQLIAALCRDTRAVPAVAAADLRRLLAGTLADIPMAARRWDRLALLIELIDRRGGIIPSAADYDQARRQHHEHAPSASALSAAYGHWLAAARAAAAMMRHEHKHAGGAPAGRSAARPPGAWLPVQIAAAIGRFHQTFSEWPTRSEYDEWRSAAVHAAQAVGVPDPELPTSAAVIRCYGTWDRALDAARRLYDHLPVRQSQARMGAAAPAHARP